MLDLGVPVTAITEAVYARALSARRDPRLLVSEALPYPRLAPLAVSAADLEAIRRALYAAKIVAYAQVSSMMSAASELDRFGPEPRRDRGDLARWLVHPRPYARPHHAGLRGRLAAADLLLADAFHDAVVAAVGDWRRVAALAVERGVADPGAFVDARRFPWFAASPWPSTVAGFRDYRRTQLSPARQTWRVPHALGPGRRGGGGRVASSALKPGSRRGLLDASLDRLANPIGLARKRS